MELAGEYTFDGPQETVWAYLQDPNVLTKVLPGCEELKETGKDEYQGAIKVKIGPIQGKFQGTIHLKNISPPDGYDIDVSGQGAPGFVKGGGGLRLEGQDQRTHMTYQGQAQIGGRIANVGQRLIESSAKAIIRQSLDALNELIKMSASPAEAPTEAEPVAPAPDAQAQPATQDAGSTPEESNASTVQADAPSAASDGHPARATPPRATPVVIPPNYTPPSQSQLAFQVAGDVASDLIPARLMPVLSGAAGGALVLLVYLLIKQLFNSRDA